MKAGKMAHERRLAANKKSSRQHTHRYAKTSNSEQQQRIKMNQKKNWENDANLFSKNIRFIAKNCAFSSLIFFFFIESFA